MKFGAFFLLHSPDVQPSHVVYKRALDEMAYADALGFDSVWIAEHHFSNYGYSPNPLLLAVKAAAVTTRVRVGTAVLVLPFWHPLRLAEDVAMADVLTEGRLDVGIARGYQHYEFNRFGLDITHNRELSEETLQVLLKALNSIGITFEGDHYHIPETTTFPRSLQQPHPPLWLAASTQESFVSAVKHGFNCFTSSSTRPLSIPQTAWKYFSQAREQMAPAPTSLPCSSISTSPPPMPRPRAGMSTPAGTTATPPRCGWATSAWSAGLPRRCHTKASRLWKSTGRAIPWPEPRSGSGKNLWSTKKPSA